MEPTTTIFFLILIGIFASSILIPPWLFYVTLINSSCDKAEKILQQKKEAFIQEAKALEQDLIELIGSPNDNPLERSFYYERKLATVKKSDHCDFLIKRLNLEKRISTGDRDWATFCLTNILTAIPFLSYHACAYVSNRLSNGPSNFLARRMVHQLESNKNA